MKYCSRCIMPATRPGLKLDATGVCSACLWHEEKKRIDWNRRFLDLVEISTWAKQNSRNAWDCVLGVSGGKDSTWQAMYLKEKLGLNPLLVQFVSSDGNEVGRQNIENLARLGFSLMSMQPNPQIARILSKESFLRFGNVHKYAEMALFAIPFRAAIMYDVPLVFFGENPALETGDCNTGEGWDATTICNNNTIGGHKYTIWENDNISKNDLLPYSFPTQEEFSNWGGKGIFMGYYVNWSGWRNASFALKHGMKCQTADYNDIGCHYKHNSLDSDFGGIVNAMLKQTKLGFGNTTEHVCYDIRNGRLTREEAAFLARELDGKCHNRYIQAYCEWTNIDISTFFETKDKFRGKMWNLDSNGVWELNNPIWQQVDCTNVGSLESIIEKVNVNKAIFNNWYE